jgi:ribonuclease Z
MGCQGARSVTIRDFAITFLGTSAASTSPYSSTSAFLVKIDRSRILVDAGIGALRQLRKIGVSPEDIDILLITHWHIDHYAGLPALLRARRASAALPIFGPPMRLFAKIYLTALFCQPGQKLETIASNSSLVHQHFQFEAIPTSHGVDSYGWAITERPDNQPHQLRKIVISGDTLPDQNILQAAREADLLVHEATYLDKDAGIAALHQHSTAAEAAEIGAKSKVGALALTHIPDRYSRLEILTEAEKIFPRVIVPAPLDTIYLDPLPAGELKEYPGWANIRKEARPV